MEYRHTSVELSLLFNLIRVHNMTVSRGQRRKDPKGYHLTFSYKLEPPIDRRMHITGHVYVDDPKRSEAQYDGDQFYPREGRCSPKGHIEQEDRDKRETKKRETAKESNPLEKPGARLVSVRDSVLWDWTSGREWVHKKSEIAMGGIKRQAMRLSRLRRSQRSEG
ncbi:hypothetical protein E4U49_005087 [Claviceps purpurea]|nr:hypothetical protein E4U49_005087 [Claviceps purpurea]